MKRKGNLYENIYKLENIMSAYDEVCRNTKSKRKVERFKQYRCINITRIYNMLKNREYKVRTVYSFYNLRTQKEGNCKSRNARQSR